MNLACHLKKDYTNQIKVKMEEVISPITGLNNVKKLNEFPISITSESNLTNEKVSNYICLDSGLIFNNDGARGNEEEFYEEEYDLHNENDLSEFKYLSNEGYLGIYDNILNFIKPKISSLRSGNILDIGCGKGLLLRNFSLRYPKWNLFGIEPSKKASLYHKRIIPSADIHNGGFEDAIFEKNKFDVIFSNGVLEHVPKPLEFLKFTRNLLKEEGICFIGVPNFKNNPVDMFTYDHLSRFTTDTLEGLFNLTGFNIIAKDASSNKVPMWYLIRKTNTLHKKVNVDIEKQIKVFKQNFDQVNSSINSISECLKTHENEEIVVYGTGSIFTIACKLKKLNYKRILCFVDDNDSIIGSSKMGIMVKKSEFISENKIKNIIISSNPCYHEQIKSKLISLNINDLKIYR